ncbi:MAG: hypothetical protein ACRCZO_12345, partial [Cetobacterium sp.]
MTSIFCFTVRLTESSHSKPVQNQLHDVMPRLTSSNVDDITSLNGLKAYKYKEDLPSAYMIKYSKQLKEENIKQMN